MVGNDFEQRIVQLQQAFRQRTLAVGSKRSGIDELQVGAFLADDSPTCALQSGIDTQNNHANSQGKKRGQQAESALCAAKPPAHVSASKARSGATIILRT